MSEKQQQPETCTLMNDISQHSVSTWFRWWNLFANTYLWRSQGYCENL